ncbi:hypothetical protein ACF3NG_05405 [Aerococcaceae bacterium WGS1372]
MIKLMLFEVDYVSVLTRHESFSNPKAVVRDNLYWSEKILLKQDDHFKVRLGGVDCFVARNKFKPHTKGLSGNIVYVEDKIWKNN